MANLQARRQARARLDRAIAIAFTQPIRRVLRAEHKAILRATATADTPAAWIRAATGAVKDSAWVGTFVTLWLSKPVLDLWDTQQASLGTPDIAITSAVRKRLTVIATEHGREAADNQRSILVTLGTPKADRKFRSTMRRALNALYVEQVANRGGSLAFIEALQASETIRYEASRLSSETALYRMRKVWFTQGDNLVRETHQKVNGKSRFVNHQGWGGRPGKFLVGGALLKHPRDPAGPPGEVINCRCWMEYRRVRQSDAPSRTSTRFTR